MRILLDNIGKRYNREWIFRKVSLELSSETSYVIEGGNGSGKSTFLQLISGYYLPSEGNIQYEIDGNKIEPDKIFKQVSIATPYLDLYEDLTLKEMIDFHFQFKSTVPDISKKEIPSILYLEKSIDKPIKYYSSGMKQRVKLGLAILADTPLLLLDEPVSNLDHKAIDWYANLISKYNKNRLILVCSNKIEQESFFCKERIRIEQYKSEKGKTINTKS